MPKNEIINLLGKIDDKNVRISPSKLYKTLYARYGDSFISNQIDQTIKKSFVEFLFKMENSRQIKMAKEGYPLKYLNKRIETSEKIDISKFYKEITGEDIVKFTQEAHKVKKIFEEESNE